MQFHPTLCKATPIDGTLFHRDFLKGAFINFITRFSRFSDPPSPFVTKNPTNPYTFKGARNKSHTPLVESYVIYGRLLKYIFVGRGKQIVTIHNENLGIWEIVGFSTKIKKIYRKYSCILWMFPQCKLHHKNYALFE